MELENWEPEFVDNFSMGVVASRRSGKTTLIKYLTKNYFVNTFDEIVIICSTISNEIYEDFPGIKITQFDEDIVKSIIEIQQEDKSKKILVILDDSVGNKIKFSSSILQLFCVSRNLNMSIIYIVQSATLLLPDHKENLDYLIIMKIKTFNKIKHIIETFMMGNLESEQNLTHKEEFDIWHDLIKQTCQNYTSIVMDYNKDVIKKYKI